MPDFFVEKDGERYVVTPMLRFVQRKDQVMLQQAFMEIPKIKLEGSQKTKMKWMDVPCVEESILKEFPEENPKKNEEGVTQ